MPSVSKAQHKLMEIAKHTPGGYGGVSQSVGEEFADADRATGKYQDKDASRAKPHVPMPHHSKGRK